MAFYYLQKLHVNLCTIKDPPLLPPIKEPNQDLPDLYSDRSVHLFLF